MAFLTHDFVGCFRLIMLTASMLSLLSVLLRVVFDIALCCAVLSYFTLMLCCIELIACMPGFEGDEGVKESVELFRKLAIMGHVPSQVLNEELD